jgi:hippurate hydrolase
MSRDPLFPTLAAECADLRRGLHEHPELSGGEFSTREFLTAELKSLGFEPRSFPDHAGVTALWPAQKPGAGCLALRADMDALPLREESGVAWASRNDGVMHACGHDGHMAVMLGVARWLSRKGIRYPKSVKLIFQPAEETGNGASRMISDGVLEDPRVEAVFGLHGWPELPAGTVAVPDGPIMAAVDNFNLRLRGRGGHGAMPQFTRDPIVAAAAIITLAQTLISRRTSPLSPAVLTFGHVSAGRTHNVIPETCELRGTLRSLDPVVRRALRDEFASLVRHAATAQGVEAELEWQEACPSTVNEPGMAARARAAAVKALGPGGLRELPPSMGGEDFAFFLERVPGAYFWLGLGMDRGSLHNPRFDFNDAALAAGIAVFAGIVEDYCG